MENLSRCILVSIFVLFEIVVLGQTTPVWNPQSSPGLGRNIRHLPCVSRRTGESGVCMFAISCAKANGTHLGTCIDRFYFGSCCKLALPDNLAEPLDNNHIYEETPSHSVPVVEAPSPSPSSSPVPLLSSSPSPTTAYTSPYSASITASSSTENYHISTFQSVQTVKNTTQTPVLQSTTTPRTTVSTTHKPTKKPTTSKPTTAASSTFTHKPISSNKPPVSKPQNQSTTVKPRPPSKPSQRPPSTNKPLNKPSVTKPPNKVPIKPSKPSNTTVSKPPQKPSNGTISKPSKPSPTKRPSGSNTSKPSIKPTSKPQTKPTSGKPQTKPPLKPVPVVTSAPPTDSNYVQLPLVTVSTSSKPPVEHHSTTISNDVVQRPTSNNSVEAEEENSNVIQENLPTTSSPLLVTWTTVDEKPLPPLPKPSSTAPGPAPLPANNETTTSSQTWVQVSMSTPGPSTVEQTSGSETVVSSTESATPSGTSASPSGTSAASSGTSAASSGASAASSEASGSETTTPSLEPQTNTSISTGVNNTAEIIQNEISSLNLNMSNYQDVCGRRLFPQSRIVGGDKASFGKWPWQISLRQWRTSTYLHKCGAALLNENWAITAAHCVENVAPSDLLLRLGEHDLSLEDEPYGYQERRVQIVASHPQFDPRTFEYDLALLRFYEPVTFQPNIIPVCVPQDDTNFVGSTAYVTGWGRLYEDGPLPSVLQEVSVPVINNTVCETMYRAAGYIEHIPEIFICAGWKKGGFDSCEGDSGGPMVIQRPDKRWLLAGVISWGIGCAEPNQPGVYTRISEFRGWINQILQF